MTGRIVVIWAMPGPWPGGSGPDPDGFTDVVRSAVTVERRATQGHLGQEELRRYATACTAIERLARRRGSPVACIAADVLDALPPAQHGAGRSRAGFHPPDQAPDWLRDLACALDQQSAPTVLAAADRIQAEASGVVLSPSPIPVGPQLTASATSTVADALPYWPEPEAAEQLRSAAPHWAPFRAADERVASARQLWTELVAAVGSGEPLQVGSGARHEVITEVLHQAATRVGDGRPVRVLYVDGSEAQPFPLHRPTSDTVAIGRTIRVGLMSMRHSEIDRSVDGYWFRNRMVSTSRTLADTDAFCAAATLGKLRELTAAGIGDIELVHTGFEPAVVGFYRGLTTWMAGGGPTVRVQPLYRINGSLVEGSAWGATNGAIR
nr:hypothetical protein GCM10020063_010380 [Dactylosporangium thailandense]